MKLFLSLFFLALKFGLSAGERANERSQIEQRAEANQNGTGTPPHFSQLENQVSERYTFFTIFSSNYYEQIAINRTQTLL